MIRPFVLKQTLSLKQASDLANDAEANSEFTVTGKRWNWNTQPKEAQEWVMIWLAESEEQHVIIMSHRWAEEGAHYIQGMIEEGGSIEKLLTDHGYELYYFDEPSLISTNMIHKLAKFNGSGIDLITIKEGIGCNETKRE